MYKGWHVEKSFVVVSDMGSGLNLPYVSECYSCKIDFYSLGKFLFSKVA